MTTTGRAEASYNVVASRKPNLIPNREVRCPCCAHIIACLPLPWTIEACQRCRRPLTLIKMASRPKHYQLCNVIDLIGSLYGIMTMVLVMSFVLSDTDVRAFAKAVTLLMFVIGSLLLTDGALSVATAIDRTWMTTRDGAVARILGLGKTAAGILAIGLVFLGLRL